MEIKSITVDMGEFGPMKLNKTVEELCVLAVQDPLTQTYNRNVLSELRSKLENEYIYMAMVDVDHLKQINDTYGHVVGDMVIKQVAARLQKVSPTVFRLGGDEFLIVSSKSLMNLTVPQATVGAMFKPACLSFGDAMEAADHLLYIAKHSRTPKADRHDYSPNDIREIFGLPRI